MAVVSAYIGKTSESGQATLYIVACRYNGRDYLQNVWVPKSAVYYYRASTCKLSVDDWVLKKVVELAVANPNKPFVDRGALLNALRTMLSTKSLDDPLHGTCKHKIKIF